MRRRTAWFGRLGPVLIPVSRIGLVVWTGVITTELLLGWAVVGLLSGVLAKVGVAVFASVLLAFFLVGYRKSEPW